MPRPCLEVRRRHARHGTRPREGLKMKSLGRTDYRRGERRVTRAIGEPAEPIVREGINVVRGPHVGDGIGRNPSTRAR